jgi:hypothetical protein
MDQQSNIELDQADEEIFTSTVSDAALEAAAGTERGHVRYTGLGCHTLPTSC